MSGMQTARQWMVTHEWMVNYNKQTEWIEKRGILLWLAFYTGGLGGGLYIISLLFNNPWGMLVGWLIVSILKGGFHFLFLGKPTRFWRMLTRPQTSWLARGFIFVVLFAGFGFLQLITQVFLPHSGLNLTLKVIAGIMALCVATYTGLILNNVKGVPFWSLPILPLMFVVCSLLGGFGITILIHLLGVHLNIEAVEAGSKVFLILNALLLAIYLVLAFKKESAGKKSVVEQIQGTMSGQFWIGVVSLGVVIPLGIIFYSYFTKEASAVLLIMGVICEVIGGMMLRYCILKAGIYTPLLSGHSRGVT